MAMNRISIDYISGGKLERQEKNFIDIKDMKPSELGDKPIEFSTQQGGNNEHIEFKLSLSASDPIIYDDILNRGQIVPFILMSDDGEWRMLKPLRSSNWRFLSDGKATMRIRLEELTKKSCCYIHFSMIDKRGDGDVISSIEPSESIPIRVVSKYRETYQRSAVEKKDKVSKKRKFQIDCEEDVTDNESQDEFASPRARVRSVKCKQRTQTPLYSSFGELLIHQEEEPFFEGLQYVWEDLENICEDIHHDLSDFGYDLKEFACDLSDFEDAWEDMSYS